MEYAECHYPGQSCTCDHRPSFIPGISSSFPPLSNHSCDIMPPLPSVHYTNKKEHSNIPTMPKRPKTNQVAGSARSGGLDCRMCERVFKNQQELEKHIQNHDEHRPHKCPQCNKGFKQPCHLNQHLRTHTDERPFPCEVCNKSFKQACQLKQHMRLHTGEKPYRCGQCNRAFKQASQLNQHERLHTGEKPYKCNHCDKTFTQASQLRSHKKTHDPKPDRKVPSRKSRPMAQHDPVVLPTFTTKSTPQPMAFHQKQPGFNSTLKVEPSFGFKSVSTYGVDPSGMQVCHIRELPVTTIPHTFSVDWLFKVGFLKVTVHSKLYHEVVRCQARLQSGRPSIFQVKRGHIIKPKTLTSHSSNYFCTSR